MSLVLAWLAPWLLGGGGWVLVNGRPRSAAQWSALLGGGWLLGMLVTGWLLTALSPWISPQHCVLELAPWMLLVAMAVLCFGVWRERPALPVSAPRSDWSRAGVLLAGVLLVTLLYRVWLLFGEASLRPLFAWDAWLVWSVKPKVWYLLDHWVPFVDGSHWLGNSASMLFTDSAPTYPALIGRLQVWFASGAGCWCEPAFGILWPSLWLALILAGYGQLRGLGVHVLPALAAVCGLGALPLLDTHAALPGYADLWLGTYFALTLGCWLHWQRWRDWRQLVLALVFGLSLPMIKLEGVVWLLLWVSVWVLGLLPVRWRWRCVVGGLLLVLAGLACGGFRVPLPGLGWVSFSVDRIVVPAMQPFELRWHPVLGSLARALWVLPNWNLLFYVAPLMVAWRWRAAWRKPEVGLMGLCLLGGAVFLFFLFTCTDAAAWAANYTSSARMMLQWVPALVFFLALLWPTAPSINRQAVPDTAPAWRRCWRRR